MTIDTNREFKELLESENKGYSTFDLFFNQNVFLKENIDKIFFFFILFFGYTFSTEKRK